MVLCMDALMAATDVMTLRPAAFREGEFTVNGVVSKMFNVLWDSGACHRSYVSKQIVEAISDAWKAPLHHFRLLFDWPIR